MIRLAVIGTNWITGTFCAAAQASGHYRLTAVYSRTRERAEAFINHTLHLPPADRQQVLLFTDLQQLARCAEVDAVYIASPNSLHYQQTLLMLTHQKQVICEKPLCSALWQTEALIDCAKRNQRVLFEAFKTPDKPNFIRLRQKLAQAGAVRKVLFNYCQYSSRYPLYQQGQLPNSFNRQFSGGSMMDIGYYCLGCALALWGEPEQVLAVCGKEGAGADLHGTVIMQYGNFEVVLWHSKISDSQLASEIQCEKGSLIIGQLADCQQLSWRPRNGEPEIFSVEQHSNPLIYEANTFARLVNEGRVEHEGLELSRITAKWLQQIRRQTGISFPQDNAIDDNK